MPWVRLHGTKDYLDLILLLERYPKLKQTVNLVPSLILQIEEYVKGVAFDPWLEALLRPMDEMGLVERRFVLERFFDANREHLIYPHARYTALHQQREKFGIDWCIANWSEQDFEDLLMWHNLCWFDPIFQEEEQDIQAWIRQGRNFNMGDRQRVFAKQQEILARIIPKHRELQEKGQLEVTTTPYTHPILPLLINSEASLVARPDMPLPRYKFAWPEDAQYHLERGRAIYREHFGCEARGVWPSEESVSPQVVSMLAGQGFQWFVADEEVLGRTLHHPFHRDGYGHLQEPDVLYRPYRISTDQGDISIIFRDHRLSDLIGFSYSNKRPEEASADLIEQLEAIQRQLKHQGKKGPHLVTIALDGENCWEFYDQDGKLFLESLYSRLSEKSSLKLVTVADYLEQYPPDRFLEAKNLHSGSWINGDFSTWIGDPVKNRAWEMLAQARQLIQDHPRATPKAWEAIWAAEGSDWFWWFGDPHSSDHDSLFDRLFREHLQAVYQELGEAIPTYLLEDLENHQITGSHVPEGYGYIQPVIDGLGTDQEWAKAGRLDVGGARGTMHQATGIQRIWYGVDHVNLFLRLDFASTPPSKLDVFIFYPGLTRINSPVPLSNLPKGGALEYLYTHHLEIDLNLQRLALRHSQPFLEWKDGLTSSRAVLERCMELALPWADLHISSGDKVEFIIVQSTNNRFERVFPAEGTLSLKMP